jgi:hypothetical protein
MIIRKFWVAAALSCLALGTAHATTVALTTDGSWAVFDVDSVATGSPAWIDIVDFSVLSFSFTVPTGLTGLLTVVDGAFAGDRFEVFANGVSLGTTGAATNNYPNSIGLDFDSALSDAAYSRRTFSLTPGSYLVTGLMSQSAVDEFGAPINASVGGLNVSLVPEPATYLGMLAGLAVLGGLRRRRARAGAAR